MYGEPSCAPEFKEGAVRQIVDRDYSASAPEDYERLGLGAQTA